MSGARSGESLRSAGARPPTASSSLRPNTGRAWPLATSANTTFDTSTRELRYRPPSAEPEAQSAPVVAQKPQPQHQQPQQQRPRPQQQQQHQLQPQRVSPARSIPSSAAARRSANPSRNIPFHTRAPAAAGLVLPAAASRGSSQPTSATARLGPGLPQPASAPPRASSLSASRSRQSSPAVPHQPVHTYAGDQPAAPQVQQQQQQPSSYAGRPGSSTRRSAGSQTNPASATSRLSGAASPSPPVSAHRPTPQRSLPPPSRSSATTTSAAAPAAHDGGNGYSQRPPAPPYHPHVVYLESMAAIPMARPSPPPTRQAEVYEDAAPYVPESHHPRRTTSPPVKLSPAPWHPADRDGGAPTSGSAPLSAPMRPSPPAIRASSATAHGRQPPMPPPPPQRYSPHAPHQPSPPAQQPQLTYYALAPSFQLTQHRHVRRLVAGELNTGAPPVQAWSQPASAPPPVVFLPQGRAPPAPPPPPSHAHGHSPSTTITTTTVAARPFHEFFPPTNTNHSGAARGVAALPTPADDTSSCVSDTSSVRSARSRHVLRRGRAAAATRAAPQGSPYGAAPMYAVRLPLAPAAGAARARPQPAAAPPALLFTSAAPSSPPLATLATDAHWRLTPPQQQQQQQQRLSAAAVRPSAVREPGRHRGSHPALVPAPTRASPTHHGIPPNQPSPTTPIPNVDHTDSDAPISVFPASAQDSSATVAAHYAGAPAAISLRTESSGEERDPDGDGGGVASPLNWPPGRFSPPRVVPCDRTLSAEHSAEVSGEPRPSLSVVTVVATREGGGAGGGGAAPVRPMTSPPWASASDSSPARPQDTTAPPPGDDVEDGTSPGPFMADGSYGDAAPTSAASPVERPMSSKSPNAPHSVHVAVPLEAEALPHPSPTELIMTRMARIEQRQHAGGRERTTASQLTPAVVQPIDPTEMHTEMPSPPSQHAAHMHHTMTPEKSGARRATLDDPARRHSTSEEPRDVDVDATPATEEDPSGSLSDGDDRAAGRRYPASVSSPPHPRQHPQPHPQPHPPRRDVHGVSPLEEAHMQYSDDVSGARSTVGDDDENTDSVHGAEQTQRPPGSPSLASRDHTPATLRGSLERDLLMNEDGAVVGQSPLAVGERDGYIDPLEEASMDAAYMLDTLEQQYVRINEETKEEMEDVVHVVELNRRHRAAGAPRTFVPKGQYSDVLPLLRYPVPDENTSETPATQLTYLPLSDAAYANLCAVVWLSRFDSAAARDLLAKAQQQLHAGSADVSDEDDDGASAARGMPVYYLDSPSAGLLTELDAQLASYVRGFVQDVAQGAVEGSAAFTAACVALTDRDNISCVRADVWAAAAARALSLADHVTNVLLSATVPREAERRRALAARLTSPIEAVARTTWTYFLGASPWNYEELVENEVHAPMPTAAARLAYAFMFKARMRNLDGGLGSLMFSMLSEQVPEAAFLDGLLMQEKLRVALRASAANVVACTALRRQAAEAAAGDLKTLTQTPSDNPPANGADGRHGGAAAGSAPAPPTATTPLHDAMALAQRSGSESTAAAAAASAASPKWTSPVLTAYLTFSEGAAAAASAASSLQRRPHGSPESLHLDGSTRRPASRAMDSSAAGHRAAADPLAGAADAALPMEAEVARDGDGDDSVADLYSVAVQLNFFFPTKTERGMHQLCAALIEDLVMMEALPVPEEVHTPEGSVLTDRTSIVDALVAEGAQAMRHIIVSLSSRRDANVRAETVEAYRTPAGAMDTAALRSAMEDCLIVFEPAVMYFLATPVPVDALFEYVVTDGPPSMQPRLTGRKSAFVEVLRLQHVAETVQYAMEMQDAILVAGQYNHLVAAHMRHDAQQLQPHASDAVLVDHMTHTSDAALLAELDPTRAEPRRESNTSIDKLSLLDPNSTLEGRDVSVRAVLMALCLADPAKPVAEVQEYLRHLLALYFELHTEDGVPVDSSDAQQLALARLATAELTTTDWFGDTTETGTLVPGASPAACDRVRVDAEELASLCPRVLGRRVGLSSAAMADAAAAVISASTHGPNLDGDAMDDIDDGDSVRVAESASRLLYRV